MKNFPSLVFTNKFLLPSWHLKKQQSFVESPNIYGKALGTSLQKQSLEVFCKKGVLRNFAKFTGKHLCQSLFFDKVAGLRLQARIFIKKETGIGVSV